MEDYAQLQTPPGYKFSEVHSNKDFIQFNFGDLPFAVTVFAFPVEQGHITNWFVSSRRHLHDPQPYLVMRLTFAIKETDRWILEGRINEAWEEYLCDAAFGSAMVPAQLVGEWTYHDPTKTVNPEFLFFHLFAHDRFAELLKEPKAKKVERTAVWHVLLQSFGVKQTQQVIANYENTFLQLNEGNPKLVTTGSINQRLQIAKKKGLLPANPTAPGERSTKEKTQRRNTHENKRGNRA